MSRLKNSAVLSAHRSKISNYFSVAFSKAFMIEGFLEWQSFSICKSAADNSTTYLAIVLPPFSLMNLSYHKFRALLR